MKWSGRRKRRIQPYRRRMLRRRAGEDRDKEITEADKQELLEKFDKESKTRTFVSPAVAMAYKIFAILVTLYHLVFASGFWMPETLKHRSLHVSMILILALPCIPQQKGEPENNCLV